MPSELFSPRSPYTHQVRSSQHGIQERPGRDRSVQGHRQEPLHAAAGKLPEIRRRLSGALGGGCLKKKKTDRPLGLDAPRICHQSDAHHRSMGVPPAALCRQDCMF